MVSDPYEWVGSSSCGRVWNVWNVCGACPLRVCGVVCWVYEFVVDDVYFGMCFC